MFIHQVLFEINKKNIPLYKKDCVMWSKEASKHAGFIAYYSLLRTDYKDQYASCYLWEKKSQHDRFFKIHHDRLVSLSKCPVKVLGYYNYSSFQALGKL